MSRSSDDRFSDMLAAIERGLEYRAYLEEENALLSGMALDAVLRNLAVIGEAVRTLPEAELRSFADVPWASIAGLRNVIVHEYFRIQPALIVEIVDDELVPLAAALRGRRS
ncbi:HepT-like ribonuclease domain-containing protein [Rathayibacter sp. VKM Ac-2754]|uniref:HepT-like ribonuclease domain-containing protein n=1 Tax=Rathayibacter sp. VKM Ac-2754 TaxID=2609251 RepID=UPI0013595807|nr:HepT-like ribonuclease domain-containing protein [Rathayibacter sp. VKM Ac-2754]MWV58250.1 DUF86 domain-containing protein [Rathayibacter sp. VKM Ac-2754]